MVEFAGFSLPVQYPSGVLAEHNHTRADGSASMFDVSHMGQIRWHGAQAVDFLHTVVVGDIAALKPVSSPPVIRDGQGPAPPPHGATGA